MTLLDTNTVIHYLKGNEAVVARLRAASPRNVAIPCVVVYEIAYGTLKIGSPKRRVAALEMLEGMEQVPFDGVAAREAARIRVELERRGESIGPLDLLIAGTAVAAGAELATNNTGEFSRVRGLRLVDWTQSLSHG